MTDSLLEVDVFQFEFNDDGAPTKLHIDDRWSSSISCEDFGLYLLMTYTQQRATALRQPTMEPSARPKLFPIRLTESVLDLWQAIDAELPSLLGAIESPTVDEPTSVIGSQGRVRIEIHQGNPTTIEVDQVWLRATDLSLVESACLAALCSLHEVLAQDLNTSKLHGLNQRLHDVIKQHNDYIKGMYR